MLQQQNFHDLPQIIAAAHELGLDQISFLTADVSTPAFNRQQLWGDARTAEIALSPNEVHQFDHIIESVIKQFAADFASSFIAEKPDKLRRLVRYYAALNGDGDFPPIQCNAPWVSTVIEADGTVRPCFFHKGWDNIHQRPLSRHSQLSPSYPFSGKSRYGHRSHLSQMCLHLILGCQNACRPIMAHPPYVASITSI